MTTQTRKRKKETQRKPDPAFPYMDNLAADIRLVGGPTILTPFPQGDSASRLDMFRGHLAQAVVVSGAEFPQIFSGKEMDFGRYELTADASGRKQDGHILAVIPKYQVRTVGINQIHENPKKTVIYIGSDDNQLHYFDIDTHYMGADGFGYKYVHKNEHLLEKDTYLPADAVMAHSPAKKGNQYNLGVNANVAYMTDPDTIEDAMTISQSLADKMASVELRSLSISVRNNEHPINHYGDDLESKFLPDIGETVGDDGILCAFRPVSTATFAADMNPAHMNDIQFLHDRVIRVPAGAKIIDLSFYTTHKRDTIPWSVYGQVEKYVDAVKTYWDAIINVYLEYGKKYALSPRMTTLVTQAYLHYAAHGGRIKGVSTRRVKFLNKADQPIDFLQINVSYAVPRKVEKAFKISDRHGT